MKKILGFLFNKITITFLLILIQIIWLIVLFMNLSEYSIWINVFFSVLSIIMFLSVIVSNQNPAYQIGWISIIAVFPILGGLFYLFMGNKRPSRRMKRSLLKAQQKTSDILIQDDEIIKLMSKDMSMISGYINNTVGYPVFEHTLIDYFEVGETMYEQMLLDLKKAEKFIFIEYFIVAKGEMWNTLKEVLIEKAKAGLDVRVIFDDFGCIKVMNNKLKAELTKAGIKLLMFNPIRPIVSLVMNHRDHRKITVIDGKIGYTGGINIADEYINKKERFGHWKDTGVRLEGEAVKGLTLMFLRLFCAYQDCEEDCSPFFNVDFSDYKNVDNGFIQTFSDSPLDDESTALNLYLDLLWKAKNYAYIFTPYLVIDNELKSALCMAAKRGVDVRIVVPEIADKKIVMQLTKSYFKQLILAGVKIYRYTPGFIHAKNFLVDDRVAIVGTINLDYRSLYLHFECGAMMIESSGIADVKEDFINTFHQSREVSLEECDEGKVEYIMRAILRLVSPLF